MKTVLIVLISIAALLGIFVLSYVAYDIITERKNEKAAPEDEVAPKQD